MQDTPLRSIPSKPVGKSAEEIWMELARRTRIVRGPGMGSWRGKADGVERMASNEQKTAALCTAIQIAPSPPGIPYRVRAGDK
jgi:hypothetical protein